MSPWLLEKVSHVSDRLKKAGRTHKTMERSSSFLFFFSLLPSGKWRCVKKFNQIDRAAWTRRKRALVPLRTHSSSAQRLTGESNARGLLLSHLGKEMSSLILLRRFSLPFIILYLHFSLFFSYIHLKVLQSGTTRLLGFPLREDYTQQNAFLWATSSSGRGRLSQKKKKK